LLDDPKESRTAANHQGPVTDEQRSAVAELLISLNRETEIPVMLREPWNYADELSQLTLDDQRPDPVNPEQADQMAPPPPQMPPMPPEGGAPMPVPDPMQGDMQPPLSKRRWANIVRSNETFANRLPGDKRQE